MANHEHISFRIATINDLTLLRHWDKQQHVIDCDPDDNWDWEYELRRFPEWREQLIAQVDDRAVGFVQIIDPREEESQYWGAVAKNLRAIDIWIGEKDDLGKGYGTKMMKLVIDNCFKNSKVKAILIDPLESNANAIRFYEKIGFRFVEKRNFGASHCMVYRLTRNDWKEKITTK